MDQVKLIQVIETTLTRRGNGTTTPIRVITQYWSAEGEILAEVDPCRDMEAVITPAQKDAVRKCYMGLSRENPASDAVQIVLNLLNIKIDGVNT